MTHNQSPRMSTVLTLLAGYGSLSVPTLLAPLANNFHHQVLPESLGMPARDKHSFSEHAAGIFGVFEKFQMIPKSIHEDSTTNVVVVHAEMLGTMKRGSRQWNNECVMMVHLSEDGTQVVKISEFVDSVKAVEMQQRHGPRNFGGGPGFAKIRQRILTGLNQLIVVGFLYYVAVRIPYSWMFRKH